MSTIRFDNYAREIERRGRDPYFRWRVFVDAPSEILREIAEVEYQLHPTFSEPMRTRTDASDRFALESAGWGEFTIQARVRFRDGREETVAYWLNLRKPWPDTVR